MKKLLFILTFIFAFVTSQQATAQQSTLEYSTFLGGSGSEFNCDMTVDNDGNMLVCGRTYSFGPSTGPPSPAPYVIQFPTTDGTIGGGGYVAKFDADGQLVYSTIIYPNWPNDGAYGITVDDAGNAYIVGAVYGGATFPCTSDAYDDTPNGSNDGYIVKLDPNGGVLYATLIGGPGYDVLTNIALDSDGNMLICGYAGDGFPLMNPWDNTWGGDEEAIAFKLSANGQTLMYSTYLGGSDNGDLPPGTLARDEAYGIAVDDLGNAYITGLTVCIDFPTTSGVFQPDHTAKNNWWEGEAFVTKLDPNGQAIYSTFLGGVGAYGEAGYDITTDSDGNAYVAGRGWNSDFPTTPGAYDENANGDGFVTKISSNGSSLIFSTAIGSIDNNGQNAKGIVIDSDRNVYVAFTGAGINFPELDPFVPALNYAQNGVGIAKLSVDGSTLLNSTKICSNYGAECFGLVRDEEGSLYITGWHGLSPNNPGTTWPLTPNAYQQHGAWPYLTGQDNYITKISLGPSAPTNQDPDCSEAAIADQFTDENNCEVTISGEDVTGVTDPDEGDELTLTVSPEVLTPGVNIVTVTADDGNSGSCEIEINVNVFDNTSPIITCPDDITVSNDPGQCGAAVFFSVVATDNCTENVTVVSVPESGSIFPVGATSVVSTATDVSGNEATCTFDVIVNDTENPTMVCPGNQQNKYANNSGCTYKEMNGEFTPTAVADNCEVSSLDYALSGATIGTGTSLAGVLFNLGVTTVTWTLTDDSDNETSCSFDVDITVDPSFVADAGEDATIYIGYPPLNTQLDASGGISYLWSPTDGLNDPTIHNPIAQPGETKIYTVTVTDAYGCEDTDDVVVEVMDVRCGKKNKKVLICHVPPGNPGNAHTICVSANAVPDHLAHGDYLGECTNGPNKPTTEPVTESLQVTVAPNPFNNRTNINIHLHDDANVEVAVYNMTGMKIRILKNGMIPAGNHTITWNGQSDDGNVVRAGLYILRVTAGNESSHNKLIKN